jgi:signal transduction histidine kinase
MGHQPSESDDGALIDHDVPSPIYQRWLDGFRPAALVLALLYALFAMVHTGLRPDLARVMVPVAAATAFAFLLMRIVLWRRPAFDRYVPWMVAGSVLLVFANSWLHLFLTRNPLQTTNFLLLVIGAGFLLRSDVTMAAVLILSLVGWFVAAWSAGGGPTWRHFGFTLLSAAGLSLVIYLARQRGFRRIDQLRQRDRARAAMLETHALRLETLFVVGRRIHSLLGLEALLDQIVDDLKDRFGYDFVGIFLVDPGNKEYLILRAGTGEAGAYLKNSDYQMEIGVRGLIGWATRHREAATVNDVTQDDRYIEVALLPDTRSEMVLPLQSGDTLIGVLDIQSNQTHAFDEEDLTTFSLLADHLATAIQNASRYEVERSRRRLVEKLYEVGRALSKTLDLHEVLNLILGNLADIVPYDRGSVLLERESALDIVAARGFPEESQPLAIRVSIKDQDVYQTLKQTQVPLIVPEVLDREDWQHIDSLPQARSWVGLPLINADDAIIGMVSLVRETPTPFDEDEVVQATAFASQAAIALQNASLYQQLSGAYRQLARLDRAKSDFIALASHELRTPLTLMMGYSQMLLYEPEVVQNPVVLKMVNALAEGAARLQEVVERMMDVAQIESENLDLRFTYINPLFLVEEVVARFTDALEERDLSLEVEDLSMLSVIEGDRAGLCKVLQHVISNAVKYTPAGGHVQIWGRAVPPGYHGLGEEGIEIVVSDTGIGIDPNHHEQIFDKFYQTGEVTLHSSGETKFKGGGPGLGLAIVRGIVEAHHGRVWVESPGYDEQACPGTDVHVVLPVRQEVEK